MSEGEGLYLIYSSHAVYCCTIFTHTEVVEQSKTRAIYPHSDPITRVF